MSRLWTSETGSCVIHEGSDKRNNLIVNRAYRALASHGTQPFAAPFENTPQRRACLPSAQSGEPQNQPAPMWASKCGAESEVVKSDHSKCQTFTSHSEMVDLEHSHRAHAEHPTTCPCARSGDRRNTQPKRRSECISRNFSASRRRRFASTMACKNLAILRAGHAAFGLVRIRPLISAPERA